MNREKKKDNGQSKNIKRVVLLAMMIALSAVGAYIVIPAPTGTVGLDSAPGYLASLLFGSFGGSIVLGLGHIFSALKSGFPLGIIHLPIAILMGGCGVVFAYLYRKINLLAAAAAAVILNGVVITAFLIPLLGMGFFISMLLPLTVGSAVNVILAVFLKKILGEKIKF